MNLDPAKLHAGLLEKGKEAARTRAYQTTTDRLRKQVRARHVVANINMGMTLGKAEHCALLEDDYIDACERAEQAEREAGEAAVAYAAAQAFVEVWRSLEATRRAEITLR